MAADFPGLDPTVVEPDSQLHRSQRYLATAYDSVSSLISTTYPALREQRVGSRGRLTHAEQDVFRAAVVFAGAGVDTVFKEALRSCVPARIATSEPANEKYLEFVVHHIQDGTAISARKVAVLLTVRDSDELLKQAYVESLTGSSLQSQTQVTRSLAALGLQSEKELFQDSRLLNPLFRVRNQIAHEMDMTAHAVGGRGTRTRHERSMTDYVDMCHAGLNYCQRVLNRLEVNLQAE